MNDSKSHIDKLSATIKKMRSHKQATHPRQDEVVEAFDQVRQALEALASKDESKDEDEGEDEPKDEEADADD